MTPRRNLPPLQSALRQVVRAEIENCGHAMMNEQPQAVVEELLKFVGSAATKGTATARTAARPPTAE
jgi:pimeloyl-ACP methyl ester carboxylesterase